MPKGVHSSFQSEGKKYFSFLPIREHQSQKETGVVLNMLWTKGKDMELEVRAKGGC